MVKCFQILRTMVLYTYMIWTVIFKDPNLTLLVREPMTFWSFLRRRDTPFWYGLKTRMTQQVKVTTESTLFNTFESTREKTVNLFQFSITKFKMSNGQKMASSSSWFLGNSQRWQQCTILMVSQHLNSESNSGTPSRFVHSVLSSWLEDSETSPKARWTFGI